MSIYVITGFGHIVSNGLEVLAKEIEDRYQLPVYYLNYAFIDKLDTAIPTVLIGHSLGADKAVSLTWYHKHRIDLCITLDPVFPGVSYAAKSINYFQTKKWCLFKGKNIINARNINMSYKPEINHLSIACDGEIRENIIEEIDNLYS